jgi:hypothetical protein
MEHLYIRNNVLALLHQDKTYLGLDLLHTVHRHLQSSFNKLTKWHVHMFHHP